VAPVRLFPLPNVVLFPGVLLPLHIFEPRYRALVADALDDDRLIGIVLLRPGWEGDYDGRPPIYPIGCSGVIVHHARLEDGRYNILLRGLDRFRVVSEEHTHAYRRAAVDMLHDAAPDRTDQRALAELRATLEARLGLSKPGVDGAVDAAAHLAAMSDADVVHTLAQYVDLDPLEKQMLLECETTRRRAESLIDLLEMKRWPGAPPAGSSRAH
jgi:Lon protease-like protein